MINIEGVSKAYDRRKVLDSISVRFEAEKTHVLLGSSGCGKSTLLRLIMGLIEPTSGHIEVNGERMSPLTQRALVQKMGYVIQDGGLFPHLTVKDNVTLVAKSLGGPKNKLGCVL